MSKETKTSGVCKLAAISPVRADGMSKETRKSGVCKSILRAFMLLILTAICIAAAIWYWFDLPVSLEKQAIVETPGGQMIDADIEQLDQFKQWLDARIAAAKAREEEK